MKNIRFGKIVNILVSLMLTIIVLLVLTACGEGANNGSDTKNSVLPSTSANQTENNSMPDDSATVSISDTKFYVGMKITSDVIAPLGDPIDVQNAPSCHFDGNDTIYVYDGYSLYTYQDGADDILYLIELTSNTVKASLGGAVGMSVDEIKNLHGAPTGESSTRLQYKKDSFSIDFTYVDGVVTMIEYVLN